jgi:N-acetylneuraminate synthase
MTRAFIIAEAGVNHNGQCALAFELVDAAAAAGADAVKFQTFVPEMLVARGTGKAEYQKRTTGADKGQLSMLRRLALGHDDHRAIRAYADARGIRFLSTPFDTVSLAFLVDELDLSPIKLPSGAVTHGPLLLAASRTGRPVILSTGMSTIEEVDAALGVLAYGYSGGKTPCRAAFAAADRAILKDKVTLLHCTSDYPARFEDVNLRAMETLTRHFNLPVGYSDHTMGINVAIAAAARGACVIEKHFTLDRTLPGPDHAASLEPRELSDMVSAIREVETALGSDDKRPHAAEAAVARVARSSLVALRPIAVGEQFTEQNLGVKRPGTGITPMEYWDWIGRTAARAYAADEAISR